MNEETVKLVKRTHIRGGRKYILPGGVKSRR